MPFPHARHRPQVPLIGRAKHHKPEIDNSVNLQMGMFPKAETWRMSVDSDLLLHTRPGTQLALQKSSLFVCVCII